MRSEIRRDISDPDPPRRIARIGVRQQIFRARAIILTPAHVLLEYLLRRQSLGAVHIEKQNIVRLRILSNLQRLAQRAEALLMLAALGIQRAKIVPHLRQIRITLQRLLEMSFGL